MRTLFLKNIVTKSIKTDLFSFILLLTMKIISAFFSFYWLIIVLSLTLQCTTFVSPFLQ